MFYALASCYSNDLPGLQKDTKENHNKVKTKQEDGRSAKKAK
jgi:hypothetical protein